MKGFEHMLPVELTTVDMRTGKAEKVETVKFGIIPPPVDRCQVCAVKHEPHLFHDCQSLFYQYAFHGRHGRWPTWADASAHCDALVVGMLQEVLLSHAPRLKWSEPPADVAAIAHLGEAAE